MGLKRTSQHRGELNWVWRMNWSLLGNGGLEVGVEYSRQRAQPVQRHWGLMCTMHHEHSLGTLLQEGSWGEGLGVRVQSLSLKKFVRSIPLKAKCPYYPRGRGCLKKIAIWQAFICHLYCGRHFLWLLICGLYTAPSHIRNILSPFYK